MSFDLRRFIARARLDVPLRPFRYTPSPRALRYLSPARHKPEKTYAKIRAFGRTYRVTSHDGGPLEVYRIEPDFSETFICLARDIPHLLSKIAIR